MKPMRETSRPAEHDLHAQGNTRDVIIIREHRAVAEFARALSTIFNPFLCATGLFVILAHAFAASTLHFWELSFAGILFYALAPVIAIFYLYLSGRISDFDMSVRAERSRAFLVFVSIDLAAALVLSVDRAPIALIAMAWGYTFAAAAIMVITRWWKISTHAFGITGPFVAMYMLFGLVPLPYVFIVPLVFWARVYLRAHTVAQVLGGAALGVVSTVAVFRFFHLG